MAYKSALMKRVFVHESMGKFIAKCREDGAVELNVIKGDEAGGSSKTRPTLNILLLRLCPSV